MQANKQRLEQLFQGWLSHSLTEGETEEFLDLLGEEEQQGKLEGWVQQAYDAVEERTFFTPEQITAMADTIVGKKRSAPVFTLKRLAAACIILLVGLGIYFVFPKKEKLSQTPVAQTHDVPAPKETRALITLADGSKVYLDQAGSGVLAQQNQVSVVKTTDGSIKYQVTARQQSSEAMVYNTLVNPRGSKVVNLTLADGTRVWLNSESSLKFPTAFSGKERKVEITGEAYFEVVHDATKPFQVQKGETEVTVLGTHFNVNAYEDEEALKVTLLEGSVKVSSGNRTSIIKPKEQAIIYQANSLNTPIEVQKDVDVDQVMAWKEGKFVFNNASIQTIMKQVMRWYDVEVVYEPNVPDRFFTADISRNTNLSELLKALELSGIHFKLEGKKLMVTK